jgi:hypothetical protein
MPQLQIQRTEVGVRRSTRQGSTVKPGCPVSMFLADGPSEAEATEWLVVRCNVDARSDDQLSLIQLAVLRQARAAINDQIAVLEKRFGKSTVDRRSAGQATLASQAARRD